MRILVATDVTGPGGVDTYVLELLAAMQRAGDDPALICEKQGGSPLARLARDRGIDVSELHLYRRWYPTAEIEEQSDAALQWSRAEGVHVVTGSPRSCLPLRHAAIARGLPLIVTESQIADEVQLDEREFSLVRESYANAAAVIFVSAGNRDQMFAATGCATPRSLVIPNGVDVRRLSHLRRHRRRPQFPARIVCVARLAPEKSISTLIAAVSTLPERIEAELTVFGDGPCRQGLEAQAHAAGMRGRFHLPGWVHDVPQRLADFDVFVLPSTAEGMPYAVLEALAVGIPVVATDAPGTVEALAGGRAGTVVPRGDARALAEGILNTLTWPGDAERKVRLGIEHVRDHHDLHTGMDRAVALWRAVRPGR